MDNRKLAAQLMLAAKTLISSSMSKSYYVRGETIVMSWEYDAKGQTMTVNDIQQTIRILEQISKKDSQSGQFATNFTDPRETEYVNFETSKITLSGAYGLRRLSLSGVTELMDRLGFKKDIK